MRQRWEGALLSVLAAIGGMVVLWLAGSAILWLLRNHRPDSMAEMVSPDGRHRIIVTEETVGFISGYCVKQVYVLGVLEMFDRTDEDDQVFAGACDGLVDIRWNGAQVEGSVDLGAALVGVRSLVLKPYAARGTVHLNWTGRRPPGVQPGGLARLR